MKKNYKNLFILCEKSLDLLQVQKGDKMREKWERNSEKIVATASQ